VVAHGQRLDVRPDLHHDAGTLVAPDGGKQRLHAEHSEDLGRRADVSVAQVLVGVAHARIGHLHPHLVRMGLVDIELLDLPRLVEAGTDYGTDLHLVLPW
jgi:hypothetical protein